MSLGRCLITAGKNISRPERDEIVAAAAEHGKVHEQREAEILAVHEALQRAINDHASVTKLIKDAAGEKIKKTETIPQPEAKAPEATPPAAEPKPPTEPTSARERERQVYQDAVADSNLVGKSLDEVKASVAEKLGDTKLSAEKLDRLARAVQKEITKREVEAKKQANRDPAVFAQALHDAQRNDGIGPDDVDKAKGYAIGWSHALTGKTKSTLSGDDLASQIAGYEAAQSWMRTDVGSAWYEGRRVNKLQNTGVDLKRWYDDLRKQMKAGESDIDKGKKQIEKATSRVDLFSPLLPDGVTPGMRIYYEGLRGKISTFRQWIEAKREFQWNGATEFRSKYGSSKSTNFEYVFSGKRYPGSMSESDREKFRDDSAFRLQWIQGVAQQYIDEVGQFVGVFGNASTLDEAANRFSEKFIAPGQKVIELNDTGTKFVHGPLWNGTARDFREHARQSAFTSRLVNEETTVKLPERAIPLTPPRLDRVTREGGLEVRSGVDVTPEHVKKLFGFADIGFGNWVGAKQDQDHLNYAHDSFADIVWLWRKFGDMSAKGVGFGGTLHFTIGALGSGKFAAHFQASQPSPIGNVPVINLTNTKGDGTVYHEWTHALDYFLGGEWKSGVRQRVLYYLTHKPVTVERVEARAVQFLKGSVYWPHLRDKSNRAKQAAYGMRRFDGGESAYKANADSLGADYWGNERELIARAGESWASDTLGHTNTYLVNPAWVGDGEVTPEKKYRGTPYPSGEERKLFNDVYTALAKSVKWQDGKPTVLLADFEANLPESVTAGEKRRLELVDIENMREFERQMQAKWAEERLSQEDEERRKKAEEQAEIDKLAQQQIAELEGEPEVDGGNAADTKGPLTDDDLENIFDEAAAELRESTQEEPAMPPPGEAEPSNLPPMGAEDGAPSPDDAKDLRDRIASGTMVLFAGTTWARKMGLPTIQSLGELEARGEGSVRHVGFGLFEFSGRDLKASWDAGGAMQKTAGGLSWSQLIVERGTYPYPKQHVLDALDGIANAAVKSSPKEQIKEALTGAEPEAEKAPGASQLIAKAASLGVKGIDEALSGLAKLFGAGPGKLSSFPGGLDESTYQKALPHFKAALAAFQEAGKTLKDLFKLLIAQFGDGVKPYAIRFAKEQNLSAQLGSAPSASLQVGKWVMSRLSMGHQFDWKLLFNKSDEAFGGTQAEGKYTPKDAYDAMEAGMNRYIMSKAEIYSPTLNREDAMRAVASLQRVTQLLPTQTKRTSETDEYQQFSTVPALAFVANWVANIQPNDTVGEFSAGIGGLAAFAKNAGAKLVLNELSSRRAAVLQEVFPDTKVYTEDAEQIHNLLPDDVKPTAVVINPPFSSNANTGMKGNDVGQRHVEQAMQRLEPNGRLVVILGAGMAMDKPSAAGWWGKMREKYDVRAVIPIDGSGYAKYGTTFDNVLVVIDKVASKNRVPLTTGVSKYEDLIGLLAEVRDDRLPARAPVDIIDTAEPDPDRGEREPVVPGQGPTAPTGEATTGGAPGVGAGQPGGGSAVGGGGARGGRSGRTGRTGTNTGQPGTGTGVHPEGGGETAAGEGGGSRPAAVDSGIKVGSAEEAKTGELTDSVFEGYKPKFLEVPGAKPHPGALVESAVMASVNPPKPTYTPNLPKKTVENGLLSLPQIEAVVYAGQAHEQSLDLTVKMAFDEARKNVPPGMDPGVRYRRGFFDGDGTGVGKGRIIGGILLDNIRQGRTRHVWVSEKQGLINDAKRDFRGVGGDDSILFNQNDTGADGRIPSKDGVLFTTYSTLRASAQGVQPGGFKVGDRVDVGLPLGTVPSEAAKLVRINKGSSTVIVEKNGKQTQHPFAQILSIKGDRDWLQKVDTIAPRSRLDQLAEWLGPKFDGVIAFDEAHNAGNAVPIKGDRGTSDPSAQARAVVELQMRLPNARIVYVSATGATEVSNLAFANRLGLWGPGTPFPSRDNFIANMTAGGLATMELVARDMKQQGAYMARSLSYDGVTYSRLEHGLSDLQRDIYNRLCDAWQVTLQNFMAALEETGATSAGRTKNGRAVGAARSAFWGAQQRFFNQIITSMQMTPTVLDSIERDMERGDAVVLQLVNTNEAQQERALAKKTEAGEADDLEDLDMTPRDQLIGMVEKSFPVVQYVDAVDSVTGSIVTVVATDSHGKPIINKEAVAMRDKLLQDLKDISVPDGPLELLLNHFGIEAVAEVTGRKQRVVYKPDERGIQRKVVDKRSPSAVKADADAFMADKKRILVFSDAGGTGFSFHADLTKVNQRKRQHYLLQPGWRANKAVQGLGRSHRTNQASAPHFKLVATDIPAQKRFLSSIARRLAQLGALTKGQRDTSSGGLFNEKDNLESRYAQRAVRDLLDDVLHDRAPEIDAREFFRQMGLEDVVKWDDLTIPESKYPATQQFLNRMLSLRLDMQNKVFDAFMARMDSHVEVAAQRGELDTGMQTIRALSSHIVREETINTDERTGAQTKYVELELTQPTRMFEFPTEERQHAKIKWIVNVKSDRVWAAIRSGNRTDKNGNVVATYRLLGTGGTSFRDEPELFKDAGKTLKDNYVGITESEAKDRWETETAARPETYTETTHMITGALLPVWDRLTSDHRMRVVRTQTDNGIRLLGIQLHQGELGEILKRFNLQTAEAMMAPKDVMLRVLKGDNGKLANGWRIERARVSNEVRVEILGSMSYPAMRELETQGAIKERIGFKERMFVPNAEVLGRILKNKPLIELTGKDSTEDQLGGRASVKGGPEEKAITADRIQKIVDAAKAEWKNLSKVEVIDSVEDLPESAREELTSLSSQAGAEPNGYFDPNTGTIYLVRSGIGSDAEALKVLTHEAVGHFGMRAVFGSEFASLLDNFITAAEKRVREMATRLGYDYNVLAYRRAAAEEVLAYMAEKNPSYGWLRKFIATIAGWARKIVPSLELTDSEIIRDFIAPAQKWIAGERAAAPQPALAEGGRARILDVLRNAGGGPKIVGHRATGRVYEADTLEAMRNTGMLVDKPTLEERVQNLWSNAGRKIAQGMFDQFAPIKEISKEAYALLRLSKGAAGAFEAFLKGGMLKLTDNVYDFDTDRKGGVLDRLLKPLQGEHHDVLRWVAAMRAEGLMAQDREHLFSEQDIAGLKKLADGTTNFDYTLQHNINGRRAGTVTRDRTLIYQDAAKTLDEFNKNALDMAEQSGLIDAESRKIWEQEFYVPFYRVVDDTGTVSGGNIKSGSVRQEAFKMLKGGTQKLNADLLDNVLMNWAHLLDASAKNRAASASLKALVEANHAFESTEAAARQAAKAMGMKDNVVWVKDDGVKHYYVVDDPAYLQALTSMEYAGLRGGVMDVMGGLKRALTIGVTASPFFKVRNLIRDSIQAIATAPIGYNPIENVAEGWKLSNQTSDAYFRLLASGGTIHFGTMLEGSESKRMQSLVESGIADSTILDSDQKYKAFYRKHIEPWITAYNELGNRGETVNRASLYAQLRKQGLSHAEASLQARDLMDFSMQGTWTAIRFLAQVVPFWNARLQGLYKLRRAAKEDPQRFATVIGATALAGLALMLAYSDDDDWKRREDWDKNNYWWFKIGGTAFRIPKPFEVGAIATLAERGFELFFDRDMTGKRFRSNVLNILSAQLSMNPIPQVVKPMLGVYANVDSFTGRPIETQGQQNLAPQYRYNAGTSMTARGISTGLNTVASWFGGQALSPVQVDYLLQGYFAWLGTFTLQAADILARPLTGQPTRPERDWLKTATGGMAADLNDAQSRYISQMYEQGKAVEQAYHDYRTMLREGRTQEAAEIAQDHAKELADYHRLQRAKSIETKLNLRQRQIEQDQSMSASDKREKLREILRTRERIARPVTEAIQ